MLVAAAVCPCPPLLVPEVAAGAAPELAGTRDACAAAVGVLAASRPDLLVVVGPADPGAEGPYPAGTPGSFRGFGVDLAVRLGSGPGAAAGQDAERDTGRELPYALAVGAWLLGGARWDACAVAGLGVTEELTAADAVELGRTTGVRADRVALLVMGDGSACRTLKAPGYLDERAEGFDALVSRALGGADTGALKALDAGLARELKAAGRAPWQVLAGAAEGRGLAGRLLHDEAPYGVAYPVAAWT